MTKYIVRCVTNGCAIDLQAPGRNPEAALANIRKNRAARTAGTFVVFERKSGGMVLAVAGPRRALPVM